MPHSNMQDYGKKSQEDKSVVECSEALVNPGCIATLSAVHTNQEFD